MANLCGHTGKYLEMSVENARNEAQRIIAEMIKENNHNEEKKNSPS